MNVEGMKKAILKVIIDRPDASFVDLKECIPEFSGERVLGSVHENLLLWVGVSEVAVSALAELDREAKIQYRIADPLTYVIDGATLSVPRAKHAKAYKKPHWLPLTLHPGPNQPNR